MLDLSDFQRGQIVGACLGGASVTKTVTLLGVSTAAVSKVMMAYIHKSWENFISKEEWWSKTKLSERDCCTLKRTVLKITEILQQR